MCDDRPLRGSIAHTAGKGSSSLRRRCTLPSNHFQHMSEYQSSHLTLETCRVAVITATYNAAQHIQSCMKSVEYQTHPNVFHVIVDGKSEDQTIHLVSSSKSERLLFVSEADNGIYSAWNKGVKLVDADWYLFLGADDILLPSAIDTLLKQSLTSSSINLVTGKSILLTDDGDFVSSFGSSFSRKDLWHHMSNANCSTIYRKTLFSEPRNFNEALKSAADYSFLLKKRKEIVSAHTSSVVSCMKLGGISNNKPSLSLYESFQERLHHYPPRHHVLLLVFFCISFFKNASLSLLRFKCLKD